MSIRSRENIQNGYENVRNDGSEETWMLLKYDGQEIFVASTGVMYDEFLAKLGDDDRAYGYIRVETGDEMSRRAKFVLITWIGKAVSPLKKAKVSTDKAFVKNILTDFAAEILGDDKEELKFDLIKKKVMKAGGANYGTGKRD